MVVSKKATTLVNTADKLSSKYNNRVYLQAKLARKLQIITGRPNTRKLISIVSKNQLKNYPINQKDILTAEHIFGPMWDS